jgi:outer membrane protein OmpA-like peptidoglycan-associated protein
MLPEKLPLAPHVGDCAANGNKNATSRVAKSRKDTMSSKVAAAFAFVLGLAGCSHDIIAKHASNAQPIQKAALTAPPARPELTKTDDSDRVTQAVTRLLGLDAEIVRLCNLHFDVAPSEEGAPRFDTDETNLTPQDTAVLNQVAACLTNGPLAGRHLKLVGRADSRGTTEYNFVLGEHRAAAVSQYLEQKGILPASINETSRGELDATGQDDMSMRDDRRVDIILGS